MTKLEAIIKLREVLQAVEHIAGPYRNRCCWCDELHPEHFQTCVRQDVLNTTQPARFVGGREADEVLSEGEADGSESALLPPGEDKP